MDEVQTSKNADDELKAQVDAAVEDVNGYKEENEKEKNDEMEHLKNSIKASKVDNENVWRELKNIKKLGRSNEKEIYKLETSAPDNLNFIKNAKSEN